MISLKKQGQTTEGLVGQGKKVTLIFIAIGSYWMVLGRKVMELQLVFAKIILFTMQAMFCKEARQETRPAGNN